MPQLNEFSWLQCSMKMIVILFIVSLLMNFERILNFNKEIFVLKLFYTFN